MSFFSAFFRTLRWRPRQALGALYWHLTGRRVRARNRLRIAGAQAPYAYDLWIETVENQDIDGGSIAKALERLAHLPMFSVIVHLSQGSNRSNLGHIIETLDAQEYPRWELVVVENSAGAPQAPSHPQVRTTQHRTDNAAEALTIGIAAAAGDFIIPLADGTSLSRTALYRYAEALQADPDAAVLFGDHDRRNGHGRRHSPWFKPRWNAEMFLAQDYLSAACVIRADAARAAAPVAPELAGAACYALLLDIAHAGGRIVHIPHMQSHVGATTGRENHEARINAVAKYLEGSGAGIRPGPFDTVRVDWPLPEIPPLVSIIVPTRDHVELLRSCISSVLNRTRYPVYEVIILDNGSRSDRTLEYLRDIAALPNVSVVQDSGDFNFSRINNFGAKHARGDYLCLLNNDTEVIDSDWLTALMRQAIRPEVGAAGAKLLYSDGSIQHAGVVVGLGEAAGHAHRFLPPGEPGYFQQAHIARFATAVTAACLVVEARKFWHVGGLDEEQLRVAFNDVDLCLKLQQAGWHNVYVPQAELFHHESKSRGKDISPKHIDRYMKELHVLQERWQTKTYSDALHHQHLDRASETYVIQL